MEEGLEGFRLTVMCLLPIILQPMRRISTMYFASNHLSDHTLLSLMTGTILAEPFGSVKSAP